MANDITGPFNAVFADGPASAPSEPAKPRIRQEVGPAIQTAVDGLRSDVEEVREMASVGVKPVISMQLATTGNVTLSGEQTIDGTLTSNSFVVVWANTDKKQNGPYVTASGAWSRMSAFDTGAELFASRFFVRGGTANANKTFGVQNATPPTVGVDNIVIEIVNDSDINGLLTEVSAGAADAGKILTLNDEGKQDISGLPKEFRLRTTGPLHAITGEVNGQEVSILSIEDDAAQTVRSKFIDALSDKAESATAKLTPLELLVGATGFSLGDGLRKWLDFDYAGGRGVIWSEWLQEIVDAARVSSQYPNLYFDGDSRAEHASSPRLPFTTVPRTTARGIIYWLQLLTGGRLNFQPDQNYGVGSQQSGDMVARMGWLRLRPPGIIVAIISTNDRALSPLRTAAQTIANLQIYQAEAVACGHKLIWIAELPRGDNNGQTWSTPLTGDQAEYHQQVHRHLLAQGNNRTVWAVDSGRLLVDQSNGQAKDTAFPDGLHTGPASARTIAEPVANIVNTIVPPWPRLVASNAELYSANCPRGALNANPMWQGTGGTLGTGCTGNLATNWSAVAGGGLAAVFSKTTDANGETVQRIVVTGTPTGTVTADDGGNIDPTPIAVVIETDLTNTAASDVLEAYSGITASGTGLRAVSLCIETTIGGSRILQTVDGEVQNAGASVPNCYCSSASFSGVSVTPRSKALSGTPTSAKLKIMIAGARTGTAGAAMNVTVDLRATSAHKYTGA